MFESPPRYKTYVLRIWEERDPQPSASTCWRYTIIDPRSHQRHSFHNTKDLCRFLALNMGKDENGKVF